MLSCRVFDVQRFSIHDGPGIRTTVFLAGCPLRCAWCQNPEGLTTSGTSAASVDDVLDEVMKDHAFYEQSGGGMTLSGGEPLLRVAEARALLEGARQRGLCTCVQTSCAVPRENLEAVLDVVDLFQVDLKHMDASRHRALTGQDNARILDNAAFLLRRGARVELRMPLIPGVNDDPENLDAVARFVTEHCPADRAGLRLVPYQRMYLDKYARLGLSARLAHLTPPSPAALEGAVAHLSALGLLVSVDG